MDNRGAEFELRVRDVPDSLDVMLPLFPLFFQLPIYHGLVELHLGVAHGLVDVLDELRVCMRSLAAEIANHLVQVLAQLCRLVVV